MTDKDAAREKIAVLVEKFRKTPKQQRESYTEQQTRESFILPMFRALGWDTENPAEMSAEEQISRGFVDFGFYLNSVPVFYLETKRIAESIDKPEHMRQSTNYSYLKGVTWAVLSDFEGTMVFNAEWEENDPLKMRFLDLQWEHYATDQFEDLWLLSKSSIQAHEIDRIAERFGRKAKKEPVTESLFRQLTGWRRELFEQMRTYGTKIWSTDPRAVDNAVQKFLDRLIFLRTVEDRGVESGHLKEVTRQAKGKEVFPNLLKLFRDMDEVYNSNLFAESELDYMEVHDPDLLRHIVEGLYRAPGGFITYDFNAITADILGAVYEQYLGFKALDPEGKEDLSKKQKRKKQGIYYTPQFVVRYIVRQTLGKMLESGADPHSLRILDPACGSGSFLIEAFDVMDRWLAQNGTAEDKDFPRRRRMRILQENLYGVDLDDQAVEVTRLNLMLRAASERNKLPLLTHIQHGNSLIDDPAIASDTAFNWAEHFPDVMKQGGFDVVIGNPPYVFGREIIPNDIKRVLTENYISQGGKHDLYIYFIERGISLLSPFGRIGYIVPNTLLANENAINLRTIILENTHIEALKTFGDRVFSEAQVESVVLILKKEMHSTDHLIEIETESEVKHILQARFLGAPDKRFNINISIDTDYLVDRLREITVPLGDLTDICIGIQLGGSSGNETKDSFISSYKENDTYQKVLDGKDINRYYLEKVEKYVKYGNWLHRKRDVKYFLSPKILIRQIGQIPVATYDNNHYYTSNVNSIGEKKTEHQWQ
ncbi:MAG: N-6 DNA methylase, partial [Chloroflexota bacterium]